MLSFTKICKLNIKIENYTCADSIPLEALSFDGWLIDSASKGILSAQV